MKEQRTPLGQEDTDTRVSLFRCTCNAGLFSPNVFTGLAGCILQPGIMGFYVCGVHCGDCSRDGHIHHDRHKHCNFKNISNARNSYQQQSTHLPQSFHSNYITYRYNTCNKYQKAQKAQTRLCKIAMQLQIHLPRLVFKLFWLNLPNFLYQFIFFCN